MSDAAHRPQHEGSPPAPPSGWTPPPPPWGTTADDAAQGEGRDEQPAHDPPAQHPPGQYGQPQYAPGQYQPHPNAPGFGGHGYQYGQPAAQPFVAGQDLDGWVPELGVRIGSAGTRIGAKAIDIVFYLIIQVVTAIAAAFLLLSTSTVSLTSTTGTSFDAADNLGFALTIAGLLLVVDFVYNVVCTALWGGTPGKLMLGLRVIGTDGRRADLNMAFKRWSPILVLSILANVPYVGIFGVLGRFVLLVANLVLVLTEERRRNVFDRVAGTYVITIK